MKDSQPMTEGGNLTPSISKANNERFSTFILATSPVSKYIKGE